MKESSTSLRWFFGIIGLFVLLGAVLTLGVASVMGGVSGLLNGPLTSLALGVIYLLQGIILIYFAFTLPRFLTPEKAHYVEWFLWGSFALTVIVDVLQFVFVHTSPDIVSLVISALITWYLYRSVHKLSRAPTQVPASIITPMPEAVVPKKKGTISTGLALIIILGLITILFTLLILYGNQ